MDAEVLKPHRPRSERRPGMETRCGPLSHTPAARAPNVQRRDVNTGMEEVPVHLELLERLPPFSWLTHGEISRIVPTLRRRTYAPRAWIQCAGDTSEGLYVVLCGLVSVVHEDDSGRELITDTLGSNELFGELALIDNLKCAASIRAESECTVLFVPRHVILACLEENAPAAMRMLRLVTARLAETHRKMARLALTSVYERVAAAMLENSGTAEEERVVQVGTERIARLVGASREMVTRVVNKMIERGVVRRERPRKLIILDRPSLAAAAMLPSHAQAHTPQRMLERAL